MSSSKTALWLMAGVASFMMTGAHAQTLVHVQEFWSYSGVEFLPGGYVVDYDSPETEKYLYKKSKFVRFKGTIPPLLKDWNFNNPQPDYLDQIDVRVFLPDNAASLLPRQVRVKNFFELDVPGSKASLLLTCYTRKLNIDGSNTNDIFLTAALNANPTDLRSGYRKLWTRKLRTETNYGEFQYQVIPGAGAFFLLYSEDVAADAVGHQLDVYRIAGLQEPKAERKTHPTAPGLTGKLMPQRRLAEVSKMEEVRELMHCLKAGDLDWLADSERLEKAKKLQVGLRHDQRTFPGKDVIFVVVFESSTKGDVFELTREDRKGHRTYRIENNGSFKLGPLGIAWPGEILGGIWTHEYLEKNIRRIMRGPRNWVAARALSISIPSVTCTSYVSGE